MSSKNVKLEAIIFCQSEARKFSGEKLRDVFELPDLIEKSRAVDFSELPPTFASVHLRPADVPLAFHRESPGSVATLGANPMRPHAEMAMKLEAFGKMLQYRFTDGVCLNGNQILYHPHSKLVARHLLPLNVNVTSDVAARNSFFLETGIGNSILRPQWQIQSEKVLASVLIAAIRARNLARSGEGDERSDTDVFITFDPNIEEARQGLKLEKVELLPDTWGSWRLNTDLPDPVSGVHYGRARLELDPTKVLDLQGLSKAFIVDTKAKVLQFHAWEEQISRMKVHCPKPPETPTTVSVAEPNALETGLSIHLSSHALIQTASQDIAEMMAKEGSHLAISPGTVTIDEIRPRLNLNSDGTVRFTTEFTAPDKTNFEIHGLPPASAYILLSLQAGLGASTGYATNQLAHARRGLKRERDMKVLRHLGFSSLIFFDAAQFALGRPLSDGTSVETEADLYKSIYTRLGSVILKSEGWPTQTGSLDELCSSNVTTLIEGFVKQVIKDLSNDSDAREVSLYLPRYGEVKIRGLVRETTRFFHAIVADLASATSGACFTRARTKYFESFMNGRGMMDREDVAVREAVSQEENARMVYQPGVNERYLLPESSAPPRGTNVFSLLEKGFQLSIDGKEIEEFAASDFRPEFNLREASEEYEADQAIPVGHQKINWFELSPKFFFRGVEITADQASRLSKDGLFEFQGKLFRVKPDDLPSLKRLTQFWKSIQSENANLLKTGKRRKTEDTYYQLPRSQTLELLALRAGGVKVRGGPTWDEITKFYDSLQNPNRELSPIPESFRTKLQPYQHTGVQWLRDLEKLRLGGILADDMGLGKTVTSLAFLESLRAEDKMGKSLVCVPTSLTYNWLTESTKFAPDIPVMIYSSKDSEAMLDFVQQNRESLVICTYGLLQENIQTFEQVVWDHVIFDEAQNLKNLTTKRTTAARKLRGEFKVCLTGTPLENHYGEFYSLFDLIVPGALGDLGEFRERFVNPVRVLRDDIDFLKLKSKPLLLRRTKNQVMSQLPPKVETTMKLPFEEGQKKIYRDIATSYNEQIRSQIAVHGESKMQLQMLTALLRLRQACSDPAAIPGVKYEGEPPKISTLVEAVTEITEGGASALVFTQFLATFDRIKKALTAANIPHYDISGVDSRLAREKKLRAFQEDDRGAVMLMTLKTGGVGLNLTKASYVFHIEPWWNPAVENQATDRAHRIGQINSVQVFRYLIKESVEEKIEVLKDVKSKRFDALFGMTEKESDLGPAGSTLTQADFEFLLG